MFDLTNGALERIRNGSSIGPFTAQILAVKQLPSGKYQLVVYDGNERMSGMVASQLSGLCNDKTIRETAVMKINQYVCSDVSGSKLIIIMQCEVMGYSPLPSSGVPPPAPSNNVPAQQYAPPVQQQGIHQSYGGNQQHNAYPPSYPSTSNTSAPSYGGSNNYGNNYGTSGVSRPIVQQSGDMGNILPISVINPYSNKWTIKARITQKGDIRHWRNAKGEGSLFSIDLLDSEGGEIRATFFKDSCEKWYPQLAEGRVYTFSGGIVKVSQNQKYTSIKNQYELTFNANSIISPAQEDDQIKQQTYHFIKINNLMNTEVGSTIDIIAIVKHSSDVTEIVSTKLQGKVLQKRELTLIDNTQSEVRLTLWGDKAASTMYNWESNPIAAFKGVRVGDFGGRSLGTSNGTGIQLNPSIPEGAELYNWLQREHHGKIPDGTSLSATGGNNNNDTLANRMSLISLKEGNMGLGEKPDYASVKGVVSYVKHDTDPWYEACPNKDCNKKVIMSTDNRYMCEKCNNTYDECNRRFILSMTLQDASGNSWVTVFDEMARSMLGVSAQDLYMKRSTGDEAGYEEVFKNLLFKPFTAKVRVKQENVNDEMRTKVTALSVAPLNYVKESKQLLEAINAV